MWRGMLSTHYMTDKHYFFFSAARRLEAMARSPIYALLSEVMDGLPTIRSLVAGSLFQVHLAFRC